MKRPAKALLVFTALGALFFGIAADARAQARNDRAVRDLVRTLNSQLDDFQLGLDQEIERGSGNFGESRRYLSDLMDQVTAFDENVMNHRENRGDVDEIVASARILETNLGAALTGRLKRTWTEVKRSIDSLKAMYPANPNPSSRRFPTPSARRDPVMSTPVRASAPGLTGTYRLDAGRSEKVADVLSGTRVGAAQRQDLESKLEAPEEIAILVSGDQVTLASSKASPVTFAADGREKTESSNGRTIRVRATLRGQELSVASVGGETDYTVTFVSTNDGNTLKVTRRITTDYLRETVFAESVYTKTDAVAGLGIDNSGTAADDNGTYSSNDPNDGNYGGNPSVITPRIGEFIVPNGTAVSAILENPIDTKVSQNNDRFRLTVQSPDEFRGAVIEGYISGVGRSGKVSGSSNVTFNFTKITLRNGKEYDFAGTLTTIKDAYGKEVKVDAEGTAKGDSQTKETAKRGGIGAGAGALLGAILGGGKGAAIGAVIGGGAGAGSVVAQGRTDIKLQQGSVITIAASSPTERRDQVSEN